MSELMDEFEELTARANRAETKLLVSEQDVEHWSGMADLYKAALIWTVRDDEELGAAVDAWFAAVREMGA